MSFLLLFDDVVAAASSYDALIESAAPDFVVLVEVQPMEVLQGWTATLTNTFYCTFSSQIATSVVPGGIYRRLDSVRQNATPLTARTSAAQVDAFLGSYYHDTAANRLYVSTTTGVTPDTFALVGAWFTLFFSTRSVNLAGRPLYLPIVTGALPTVTEEMPDTLFGSIVSDTGSISFLNGDKLFDRLSKQYVWRNKTVTVKLGGTSLAYSDYTPFTTMRINGISPSDEVCTLELETMGSILNRTLPIRTWGDFEPARPPTDPVQGLSGVSQPIVLGTVVGAPTTLAQTTGVYYVYDNHLVTTYAGCQLAAVYSVDKTTKVGVQLVSGQFSTTADQSTIFILDGAITYDQFDIVVSIYQLGTVGSPFFGTMARALLEICGESSANIDAAAFAAADAVAQIQLARYIAEPRSAMEWMMELCQSVGGQVYVGSDGRWTCRLIRPDLPATITELTDEEGDFMSWEPVENLSAVLNEVRVRHSHRPYTDEWTEATSSDDVVKYGSETSDSHSIDTWLTSAADATVQAQHQRFFKSSPPMLIATEERGLKLMTAHAGDMVSVTRERAPVARTGSYDGHLLRIVKIEKSLGPDVPTVRVTLSDLDGQTERIARYTANVALTWSTATAQEQARYGFYGDSTGYDVGDPLTRNGKVYY